MEKEFSLNDWLEYLREMLRGLVLKEKECVFLLSDQQIV
jgi:hypothetical protein